MSQNQEVRITQFRTTYVGNFEYDKNKLRSIQGNGAVYYCDHLEYIGDIKDSYWHGFGTYYFKNGCKLTGQFDHDIPYGICELSRDVNGKKQVFVKGIFKSGCDPKSRCIIYGWNQSRGLDESNLENETPNVELQLYNGDIKFNYIETDIVTFTQFRTTYVGYFEHEENQFKSVQGVGKVYFCDQLQYEGDVKDSYWDGFGTYYFKNGCMLTGYFEYDLLDGPCELYKYVNGKKKVLVKGTFKYGCDPKSRCIIYGWNKSRGLDESNLENETPDVELQLYNGDIKFNFIEKETEEEETKDESVAERTRSRKRKCSIDEPRAVKKPNVIHDE